MDATSRLLTSTRTFTRRRALAFLGASGASLLLAACGARDGANSTSSTSGTSQPGTDAAATSGTTASVASTAAATAHIVTVTPSATTDDIAATATAATTTAATPATAQGEPLNATGTTSATPAIVAAANAFLDTLSADEQSAVMFGWSNATQKQRWSNFPEGLFERDGLMWGNISATAQDAWLALMQATLSADGYTRVMAEWYADDVLAGQSGNSGAPSGGGMAGMNYGRQYYWIAIIGTPSASTPWQWQFGGHHITVNATVAGDNIALTPSFIGVQPGTFTDDAGNSVRPLGDIIDDAFALVNALDATQQASAIRSSGAIDLVLGPGQDGVALETEGLLASDMTDQQQAILRALIGHYTGLVHADAAAIRDAEIEATFAETAFAWYGPTTEGSAVYFRVSGPRIVIEYSPQSLGGDPANHIHGIYRDPANDYGVLYTS